LRDFYRVHKCQHDLKLCEVRDVLTVHFNNIYS
jgi:hypothetical protein